MVNLDTLDIKAHTEIVAGERGGGGGGGLLRL